MGDGRWEMGDGGAGAGVGAGVGGRYFNFNWYSTRIYHRTEYGFVRLLAT
jgi:hypothetical protein